MTKDFCNRFGCVSHAYSRYRPTYPADLFEWLASIAPSRSVAWDCATGSGQAAVGLAEYFDRIIATDASEEQLRSATPHDRIEYRQAMAERSGIADASIDLITVAQALHWFDIPQFYVECHRALKPFGALTVWTYGPPRIENESINAILLRFYHEIVGDYWPPERAFVDTQYATLKLPYPELQPPQFEMSISWTLDELLGYLGTWSSTSAYRQATGSDPRELIEPSLRREWPEASRCRKFEMPLTIRACKKL
jgi:SAM-dependent methyltransferase